MVKDDLLVGKLFFKLNNQFFGLTLYWLGRGGGGQFGAYTILPEYYTVSSNIPLNLSCEKEALINLENQRYLLHY